MIEHCVRTIQSIIAEGRNDRRSILQLGYNLGRLSELTGLGREPFWDRWKVAVEDWDVDRLVEFSKNLEGYLGTIPVSTREIVSRERRP